MVLLNASKEGSTANIYTFDRGVSSITNFSFFNKAHIHFVGRLKTDRRYDVVFLDKLSDSERNLGELVLNKDGILKFFFALSNRN